jgi:hypothetical protein
MFCKMSLLDSVSLPFSFLERAELMYHRHDRLHVIQLQIHSTTI